MPRLGVRRVGDAHPFDLALPVGLQLDPATRRGDILRATRGAVVIPAHNEAKVIGRTLDQLFASLGTGVEVIVVCNGCTDDTADVARRSGHPLTVIELDEPSKSRALRAGDRVATAFPRAYLDGDVLVTGRAMGDLLRHLSRPGALAARPPLIYDTSSSSWVVRRFYRARMEIPAVMCSLWGAGLYALSAEGRARFGEFPVLLADDLFVDRLFGIDEIDMVDTDPVVVVAPRTTAGLVTTFRRVFRGNRAMADVPGRPRPGTRATVRDLLRLARRGRSELADAAVYAAVVTVARVLAWLTPQGSDRWERDETSRR